MSTIALPADSVPVRQVRLTRRGRLVVFLAALLVLFGLGLVVAGVSGASEEEGAPVPTRSLVVGSGETLWDISAEAAERSPADDSIREMQRRIEELNSLDSPVLTAGQRLRVPIG